LIARRNVILNGACVDVSSPLVLSLSKDERGRSWFDNPVLSERSSFDKLVLSERSSFDKLRMSGSRRAQDERESKAQDERVGCLNSIAVQN
jgi:hypothetical protein